MAISFDYIKRLGAGYFGEVWHAIDVGLDCECALKLIPKEKVTNKNNYFQEAQILKLAEHPNIVKVLETGAMDDDIIYVKMEYLKNGSLEDEAKGAYVKLSRAKILMIDVLRGLEYAHSKGIIHRDIKPANILIGNSFEGKLSDFGLALPNIENLDLTSIKKYQYLLHLAPEVTSFEKYTYLSDIYACGATLYRLVNGDDFLPRLPISEVRERTQNGTFPNRGNYRLFIPRSMRLLINRALNIDPKNRFQSAEKMRHSLEKIIIEADWEERKIPNGIKWLMKRGEIYHMVALFQGINQKWNVRIRKGKNIDKLRKYKRLSKYNLSYKKAEIITKRLLQKYVKSNA